VELRYSRLASGLLLASACAVEPSEETSEPTASVTHALVRVERSELVGAEVTSGVAFAGIVRAPQTVDTELLLRLSGVSRVLPAVGSCATPTREHDAALSAELGRAEFVAAGDVLLRAAEARTQLAPRAFPSSQTQLLSGIVYTSRDRASQALPGNAHYVLSMTGGEQLRPIELGVSAPAVLEEVRVAGVSAAEVTDLDSSRPVALSWLPGEAQDRVYVEVSGASGLLGLCAFRDELGAGELPAGLFGAEGSGTLTLHRLREVAADVPGLDAAEVRFDFELALEVDYR
jgi:hypothetical protein